jgi:hypothetical protein
VAQPHGELLEEPVADVVSERVVDLLEAVQVEQQQRELTLGRAPIREVALEAGEQMAAVRQPGELVGERLAARGVQRVILAHGQRQAHEQAGKRRDGEAVRNQIGVTHPVVGEQAEDRRAEGQRRGQRCPAVQARRPSRTRGLPRGGGQAQERRHPDAVEQRPLLVAAGRGLEQVRPVGGDVERHAERQHCPGAARPAAADHERRGDQGEHHGVADRVGERGRDRRGIATGSCPQRREQQRRDEARQRQRTDQPVEPHAGRQPPDTVAQQQRQRDVVERIAPKPEPVADRRVRRRRHVAVRQHPDQLGRRPHDQGGGDHPPHRPPALGAKRPNHGGGHTARLDRDQEPVADQASGQIIAHAHPCGEQGQVDGERGQERAPQNATSAGTKDGETTHDAHVYRPTVHRLEPPLPAQSTPRAVTSSSPGDIGATKRRRHAPRRGSAGGGATVLAVAQRELAAQRRVLLAQPLVLGQQHRVAPAQRPLAGAERRR